MPASNNHPLTRGLATPAHPALAAMLDRCGRMGLIAAALGPDGTIQDVRTPHPTWTTVLVSQPMASALRRCALSGAAARMRAHHAPTVLDDGLCTALCPVSDDEGLHGFLAVLMPAKEARDSSRLLLECVRSAGLGETALSTLARTTPTHDPASAGVLAHALRMMGEDQTAIRRGEAEVAGFTKQLTGAFETIDLLYNLGRSLKAPFSPLQFLRTICTRTRATLCFRWVAVYFDTSARTPQSLRGTLVHDGEAPTAEEGLEAALAPVLHDQDTSCKIRTDLPLLCAGSSQCIAQPLLCKGHQVGVLVAGGKHGDDPLVSSYDTQLIEACAGFLAAFTENVALYDEQRQLFLGTLGALVAAIDAKDRYTCGHSERVALLSRQIAEAAGLSPLQCEDVRVAGLVHDVGKIGVPEAVLLKPGRLNADEFELIKKHPAIGHHILEGVTQLANVLPGVLHHHERYDGAGYPHGLAGADIPLMARIIAVADTFDAMSSDRSYRARMPREQVLGEIRRGAGSQLDPRLAEIMQTLDFTAYDTLANRHATESEGARKAA